MSSEGVWTQDEQQRLEDGILKCVSIIDPRDKWKAIAQIVDTRGAKACLARFHACREEASASRAVKENGDSQDASEADNAHDGDEEEPQAERPVPNEHGSDAQASSGSWDRQDGWWNSSAGWSNWSSSRTGNGRGRGQGGYCEGGLADRKWEGQGRGWGSDDSKDGQGWSGGWEESSKTWKEEEEEVTKEDDEELLDEELLDEGQRRALEMKREVEANRERMRQRQENRGKEEADKAAKLAAKEKEAQDKQRERVEAKEKEYQEAVRLKKEQAEQQRQREIEAERKDEQIRTEQGFFGKSLPPPVFSKGRGKGTGLPAPGGWAAKAGQSKGQLAKQRKQEEMERQAAEVLANMGVPKKPASRSQDDGGNKKPESPPKASSSANVARKVAPIGPPTRQIGPPTGQPAAEPAEETEDFGDFEKPARPLTAEHSGNTGDCGKGAAGKSAAGKGAAGKSAAGKGAAGKGAAGKDVAQKSKKTCWWERLDSSIVCPISLAPICELPKAPFALGAEGSSAIHYYDARFLANFLVSSCDFIDPVNRRELTHEECTTLDEHLQRHHPESISMSVADAFALFEINGRGGSAAGDDRVQREATAVLQHLFRFQSARRTDRSGHAINYAEGGLTVVDDDDVLTAHEVREPPVREQGGEANAAEFPQLSGAPGTSTGAASGAWKGKASGVAGQPAFPDLATSAKPKSVPPAKPKGQAPKSSAKAKPKAKKIILIQPKGWGAPPR